MSIEDKTNNIIEIIKKNNLVDLAHYFEENNISSQDFNNFDLILLNAIENNASIEIIKFIINQRKLKNLNYHVVKSDKNVVPLFAAIAKNNFKIADLLIDRKAHINIVTEFNDISYNIIFYLFHFNLLNNKNLKYILNNGFSKSEISNDLLVKLVEAKNNEHLEIIFRHFKFGNSYILNFLNIYKNAEALSDKSLQNIIDREKQKFIITETMYEKAIKIENYEALSILFEYESSNDSTIFYRVNKFDLLEKSMRKNKSYEYIKSLLHYITFNYKHIKYEEILSEAIRKYFNFDTHTQKNFNKHNIAILLIETFLQSSSPTHSNKSPLTVPSNHKYSISYLNLVLNIAIKMENLNAVQYLVDSDDFKINANDINKKDINEEYPIITAFYTDNTEIFEYLLEHGANSNTKNNNRVSLLDLAIHKNKVKMIESLLKYKVNIIEKDNNGNTPLAKAISNDNPVIVEQLITYANENKLDLNINDYQNFSKLSSISHSIKSDHIDIEIVEEEVKVDDDDDDFVEVNFVGNYPLIKAINQNNFNIVLSLINYGIHHQVDMNITDIYGNTPLILAYKHQYMDLFRYLVKYLDINQKDSLGNTILDYAIAKNDVEMVKDLISIGSNINSVNDSRNSILVRAISQGNIEILKILLQKDHILLDKKNSDGEPPLIMIIKCSKLTLTDKETLVDIFIEKGANINLTDNFGNTALICAIQKEYVWIMKLLIENGANIFIKNLYGMTSSQYALGTKNDNIIDYLYDHGDFDIYHIKNITFETLLPLVHSNNLNLLRKIIENNIDIDINMRSSYNGNTLLHEALLKDKPEIVVFLLEHGADRNIKNNDGRVPYDINKIFLESDSDSDIFY